MPRKYSYWYVITEVFDPRYKLYQRLIWKHPKDVGEVVSVLQSDDKAQDFVRKNLFRVKYICKTRFIEDNATIPDDVIAYVDEQWKRHGYPLVKRK